MASPSPHDSLVCMFNMSNPYILNGKICQSVGNYTVICQVSFSHEHSVWLMHHDSKSSQTLTIVLFVGVFTTDVCKNPACFEVICTCEFVLLAGCFVIDRETWGFIKDCFRRFCNATFGQQIYPAFAEVLDLYTQLFVLPVWPFVSACASCPQVYLLHVILHHPE